MPIRQGERRSDAADFIFLPRNIASGEGTAALSCIFQKTVRSERGKRSLKVKNSRFRHTCSNGALFPLILFSPTHVRLPLLFKRKFCVTLVSSRSPFFFACASCSTERNLFPFFASSSSRAQGRSHPDPPFPFLVPAIRIYTHPARASFFRYRCGGRRFVDGVRGRKEKKKLLTNQSLPPRGAPLPSLLTGGKGAKRGTHLDRRRLRGRGFSKSSFPPSLYQIESR